MKNSPMYALVNIALWVLTAFLTYTFAVSCYHIFSGDEATVSLFNKFGGKALRTTVALLEGLGAVLILIPRAVILGSALLVISVIGMLAANMSTAGGIPTQPALMLVLTLVLLVGRLYFPSSVPLVKED